MNDDTNRIRPLTRRQARAAKILMDSRPCPFMGSELGYALWPDAKDSHTAETRASSVIRELRAKFPGIIRTGPSGYYIPEEKTR